MLFNRKVVKSRLNGAVTMRVVLWCTENDSKAREQDKKQQQRILESFQTGTFEEIVASTEANVILHIVLYCIKLSSLYSHCTL